MDIKGANVTKSTLVFGVRWHTLGDLCSARGIWLSIMLKKIPQGVPTRWHTLGVLCQKDPPGCANMLAHPGGSFWHNTPKVCQRVGTPWGIFLSIILSQIPRAEQRSPRVCQRTPKTRVDFVTLAPLISIDLETHRFCPTLAAEASHFRWLRTTPYTQRST